jgi:hypothetical protein
MSTPPVFRPSLVCPPADVLGASEGWLGSQDLSISKCFRAARHLDVALRDILFHPLVQRSVSTTLQIRRTEGTMPLARNLPSLRAMGAQNII